MMCTSPAAFSKSLSTNTDFWGLEVPGTVYSVRDGIHCIDFNWALVTFIAHTNTLYAQILFILLCLLFYISSFWVCVSVCVYTDAHVWITYVSVHTHKHVHSGRGQRLASYPKISLHIIYWGKTTSWIQRLPFWQTDRLTICSRIPDPTP